MKGLVLSDGETSDTFAMSIYGVKRGCVLGPVLFNLFLACVLSHAVRDNNDGVYLKHRTDGSLFDLRSLSAKTKKVILKALFADDCTLMAHKESALQLLVNKFADAARFFGLTLSLGKTEVLFQPAPLSAARWPPISIEGTALKNTGVQIPRHGQYH